MRQLGDLIESIHIMQYTCSVLLILQAMSFLRVAKGYARLGPSLLALHAGIREFTIECVAGIVTQTLAYAKSELLHFSAIFFFVLFIYAQSGHFMCKGRGNPFSICRAVRVSLTLKVSLFQMARTWRSSTRLLPASRPASISCWVRRRNAAEICV